MTLKPFLPYVTAVTTTVLSLSVLSACGPRPLPLGQAFPGQTLNHSRLGARFSQFSTAKRVISDQVVVKFKTQPTADFLNQYAQQNQLQVLKVSPLGSVLFRRLAPSATADNTVRSMSQNKLVAYSHPNTLYYAFDDSQPPHSQDPRSGEQTGQTLVGLPQAWQISSGDPRVVIAIVDSGVDLNHPDLKAKLVPGFNLLNNNAPPQDDNGHGTHCSGIAAASTNNGIGVAGACPNCSIMPIKVLDQYGSGSGFDVANGVIWATDHGAQVINLSLGGMEADPTLEEAVHYAIQKNVVVVAAAGNESTSAPMYPAAEPEVISVGSINDDRQRSDFSNFGTSLSIMAPGRNILSTMPTVPVFMTEKEGFRNEYDFMDGTSMASPMVAGVAGLIRSRYPNLTPAQIKTQIEQSAQDLGAPGFDADFGYGALDAVKALQVQSNLSPER